MTECNEHLCNGLNAVWVIDLCNDAALSTSSCKRIFVITSDEGEMSQCLSKWPSAVLGVSCDHEASCTPSLQKSWSNTISAMI